MYFDVRFSVEPILSSKTEIQEISFDAPQHIEERELHSVAPAPRLAEGHTDAQQNAINYAWEVSNGDMRFLYLLTAENGQYTHDRSHPKQANTVGQDHGFCGVNDYYHNDIVSNPLFLEDWQWQMRECYRLYTGGTTFWGIHRYDTNLDYRQRIHVKFQ